MGYSVKPGAKGVFCEKWIWQKLEKVVNELENDNLSLDESVKKFQNGIELSAYCNKMLDDAEKKISILIENNNGTIQEENLDIDKEENTKDDDME